MKWALCQYQCPCVRCDKLWNFVCTWWFVNKWIKNESILPKVIIAWTQARASCVPWSRYNSTSYSVLMQHINIILCVWNFFSTMWWVLVRHWLWKTVCLFIVEFSGCGWILFNYSSLNQCWYYLCVGLWECLFVYLWIMKFLLSVLEMKAIAEMYHRKSRLPWECEYQNFVNMFKILLFVLNNSMNNNK